MNSTETSMRYPDFYIIGAPKCGTTSLFGYLSGHPSVFIPRIKEPFYFCTDMPGYRERVTGITTEDAYLGLFTDALPKHTTWGEASTYYLFSDMAVSEIIRRRPDARMIVMLRNPVDMAYSFHAQLLFGDEEDVTDFEEAWNLQPARERGFSIPPGVYDAKVLQYARIASFGKQVERLLKLVPRNQVRFILFEDFALGPTAVYADVLQFLGLAHDGRRTFPIQNGNKRVRNKFLWNLMTRPPFPLNHVKSGLKSVTGSHSRVSRFIYECNLARVRRPPLPDHFARSLRDFFRDDISHLGHLIGRRLGHWLDAPRETSRAKPSTPLITASHPRIRLYPSTPGNPP